MPAALEGCVEAPSTFRTPITNDETHSSISHQRTHTSIPSVSSIEVGSSTTLIPGETLFDMPSFDSSTPVSTCVEQLSQFGYLLLRNVLPIEKVRAARTCVCEALSQDWNKIDLTSTSTSVPSSAAIESETDLSSGSSSSSSTDFTSPPLLRASIAPCASSPHGLEPGLLLTGFRGVTHDRRTLDLLEGTELSTIFGKLFGQQKKVERRRTKASERRRMAERNTNVEDEYQNDRMSRTIDYGGAGGSSPSTIPAGSSSSVAPLPSPSHDDDSTSSSSSLLSYDSNEPLVAPSTFDTKWVRIHGFDEFTDEHTDYYRFEQWDEEDEYGAHGMYTCWIPLGDYPVDHGTLVVAEGTHLLSGYSRGVYDPDSRRELPPDFEGWRDGTLPDGSGKSGIWRTSHFHPGDCVIFDIRLIHASTRNRHREFRISMDTRWKATAAVKDQQRDAFNEMARQVRR